MKVSQRLGPIRPYQQDKGLPPTPVPFGEWHPDISDYRNPGCTVANGVRPIVEGYGPMPALTTVSSNAMDAQVRGGGVASDSAGNTFIYSGDAAKLYSLVSNAFVDVSKGGGYTGAEDSEWEFALFGSTMVATNFSDAVQGITLGASAYSDLFTSTLKPKARHVDVVRDFLVLGNTNDSTDGAMPNRVWWSGINDATDMDPDAQTQSDYQDFPDGGWVQRVVGGVEFGLVLQERQIQRMTYAGSPLVFRFDAIDRRRGTPIPNSVVSNGRMTFFISEEGFFVNDGQRSQPIGHGKVDKTFWAQFDTQYISRVSTAVDPVNKLIMWAFPGTGNTAGAPNKIYFYNWADDRWSEADIDAHLLLRSLSQGYTLDGLDAVSTDLDALGFSLDSRAWTGGEFTLAAFDQSDQYATFTGANVAATVETTEFDVGGRRSLINNLRPLVDGGTVTCAVASKPRLLDTSTFGSAGSMNTNGDVPILSEGRYHKVRTSIAASGTWNKALGVDVKAAAVGVN